MVTILGIESTAHTFGVGVVRDGKILANVRDMYTTESGGIIPMDSAKHHANVKDGIYEKALKEAGINEKEIDAIAFSQGPGLAPCLLEGMKFAKELARKLASNLHSPSAREIDKNDNKETRCSFDINNSKNNRAPRGESLIKNIPIIPVNHCVAHLEVGKVTGARDPVMLYASGANTQVIAYASGKYRVFGETLDIGVGNFIDNFARFLGLGFPGGPAIQKLAEESKKEYIELPYTVKGMDIALSGILTNLKQKIASLQSCLEINELREKVNPISNSSAERRDKVLYGADNKKTRCSSVINSKNSRVTLERGEYTIADLAFSMQETVFAMLVETAERALAHTGKSELLLGGGVACNSRLQEMCKKMCEERLTKTKFFVPDRSLLVDNGAMIAFLGEIMFKAGIKEKDLEKVDIMPRQRTDDVEVRWR